MRYLKLFEKYSKEEVIKMITEFSNPYLIWLFEIGFDLQVKYYPHLSKIGNGKSCESIIKLKYDIINYNDDREERPFIIKDRDNLAFKWSDVKDYIIPYILILNKKYDLCNKIEFNLTNFDDFHKEYSIDELINNDIKINNIYTIRICFDI